MVEAVPKEIAALSGVITESPKASQALSVAVVIRGSPSGIPERSQRPYPGDAGRGQRCGRHYR